MPRVARPQHTHPKKNTKKKETIAWNQETMKKKTEETKKKR
jgi:hypothetical protein